MKSYKPTNSYRFELSKQFNFEALVKVLNFVKSMGIDLVYTSPFFKVAQGSNNPYEIVSSQKVDLKYAGLKGFYHFAKKVKTLDMGLMIDIVPNHMASSPENPWFFDVLKNGASSPYFSYFAFRFKDQDEGVVLPYLAKGLNESIRQKAVYFDKRANVLCVNGRKLPVKKGSENLELKRLVVSQHYRLVDYHDANKLVNFRRFFDIHELIGVNMQLSNLFDSYHSKILQWYNKGYIKGFRVDHPDGLLDPALYFQTLKKKTKSAYIVAEKILQSSESLPKEWQIMGSVGYDFLNTLNQLFVDKKGEVKFNLIYKRFSGSRKTPEKLLVDLKKSYIKQYLASELDYFSEKIHAKMKLTCSKSHLKALLCTFLAHLRVYRTYVKDKGRALKVDRLILEKACHTLKAPFKKFFLHELLSAPYRQIFLELQEIMPAIFAKGFEDTFLYRYIRLTSLNEVGSSLNQFGIAKTEFLKICQQKIKKEPYTMTTSSTHDTKRSEDVRQRINVLSQMPNLFNDWLYKARKIHTPLQKRVKGVDKTFEYLFYQTLIGIWPSKISSKKQMLDICNRVIAYCIKASREAKKYTDWVHVDQAYEDKITVFIKEALKYSSNSIFYQHMHDLIKIVAPVADKSSISSLLIRLTTCGVFDLYQGQEFFKFDLVDPDNRRVVDFKKSENLLKKVCLDMSSSKNKQKLLSRWYEDLTNNKFRIWMLKTLLNFRKENHNLFIHGTIKPLKVSAKEARGVLAFYKIYKNQVLFVIAPLFIYRLQNFAPVVEFPFAFKGKDLLTAEEIMMEKGQKISFIGNSVVKVIYAKVKKI